MLWVKIKRLFLGLHANFLALLTAFCQVIQAIRKILLNLLMVPPVVLTIMLIGTCALFLIGAFMMDGPIWGNLAEMGGLCAGMVLIYFLANAVFFVASRVFAVLEIFNCEWMIARLAGWIDVALDQYLHTIGKAPITKADYRYLYGLPRMLHTVGRGIAHVLNHSGMVIYPLSAWGGFLIGRSWYRETWDSGWRPVDYVVAVVMTLIIMGLMVYVGSYVTTALQDIELDENPVEAVYESQDDFFSAFGRFR